MKQYDIGFELAYRLAMDNIHPIGHETISMAQAVRRVLAAPVPARVDSPSVDASLKDGYAVVSSDLICATQETPVALKIIGCIAAGRLPCLRIQPGTAMRILSGAPVPEGSDAVLADEFAKPINHVVYAYATAEPGRNILPKGSDVRMGEILAEKGQTLTPQRIGLLTAGGVTEVAVYKKPKIGLLATGSEILLPGRPLKPGKLYASNVSLQQAWFEYIGFECRVEASGDEASAIAESIQRIHDSCDILITSGGAWKGDRDLTVRILETLGWRMCFHRVRMGPGKAVAMGFLNKKPVFCLPGGPASNEMAFMMIVFPAILKYAGFSHAPFFFLTGRLEKEISGQKDWTQFIQCQIIQTFPEIILCPGKMKSRLAAMTKTHAIVKIPEGIETIPAGAQVPFLCLNPDVFALPVD